MSTPRERPEDLETKQRRRLFAWLVVSLGGSLAAVIAVGVWLGRTPFYHPPRDLGPSPVELVRASELRPVDAGLRADAGPDAGDVYIRGRAPGPAWSARTRNYLLVGVDRKPWGRGGALADTLILVAVDRTSGHVGLVSVPRDYYLELGPGVFGRINGAMNYASQNHLDRLGFLAEKVGGLLGLDIEHVVVVDLTVLEHTIDSVEGVEVLVPCPIRDNFVDPRTPTGRRMLDVPAGDVHMDGVTAAMYARSRHGRSDWDRARRQQAVLLALRRKLTSATALPLLPELLDQLGDHLETDLDNRDMLELVRLAMRIDPANLHGMVLSSQASQHFRTDDGRQVLVPDVDAVRNQIRALFEAPPPGVDPRHKECAPAEAALEGRVAVPLDGGAAPAPTPTDDGED
ncbi:MAG: LCP family protein [Polyangiales bacterium]